MMTALMLTLGRHGGLAHLVYVLAVRHKCRGRIRSVAVASRACIERAGVVKIGTDISYAR